MMARYGQCPGQCPGSKSVRSFNDTMLHFVSISMKLSIVSSRAREVPSMQQLRHMQVQLSDIIRLSNDVAKCIQTEEYKFTDVIWIDT